MIAMPGSESIKHPLIHMSSGCTAAVIFIAITLASMKEWEAVGNRNGVLSKGETIFRGDREIRQRIDSSSS